jgi:predicted ATPase
MELACEIKGKRPKLISISNDKMTTVREICGLFDQTASNQEHAKIALQSLSLSGGILVNNQGKG